MWICNMARTRIQWAFISLQYPNDVVTLSPAFQRKHQSTHAGADDQYIYACLWVTFWKS